MASRHFCCCIPVRLAVFVFSFISFVLSAATAFAGWFLLHLIVDNKLSEIEGDANAHDKAAFEGALHEHEWAVILSSVIFTLIALISLLGFIGTIIRNRWTVRLYSYLTIFTFLFGTLGLIFLLYATWSQSALCVTVDGEKSCTSNNLSVGSKIGITFSIIIQWFIQLYIVVIIRRYATQLDEEREYRSNFRLNPTAPGTYEAGQGLLATQAAYPYSDNQHSFGPQA
ncbi:hypothetical protein BD414DRAFT_501587 [Trametes punicea]|nr:hypothetical protein BD414DRAFT_501587 [Trametes punicea]